jgi:hypothetical protein
MKTAEVDALPPDYLRRIVRLEARFAPRRQMDERGRFKCEGLWFKGCKGTRGGEAKPGSMTESIRQRGLLSPSEIAYIWNTTPGEIISFQEGYARAKAQGGERDYVRQNKALDYRGAVHPPGLRLVPPGPLTLPVNFATLLPLVRLSVAAR